MLAFPKTFAKLKKNTKRGLNRETTEAVLERDGGKCICCPERYNLDPPHHAFFGALDANWNSDRNDIEQLVTICKPCHYAIHSKGDTKKREHCKQYLKDYYQD